MSGSTATGRDVRVYAFCTRPSSTYGYKKGSLTFLVLNTMDSSVSVDFVDTHGTKLSGMLFSAQENMRWRCDWGRIS